MSYFAGAQVPTRVFAIDNAARSTHRWRLDQEDHLRAMLAIDDGNESVWAVFRGAYPGERIAQAPADLPGLAASYPEVLLVVVPEPPTRQLPVAWLFDRAARMVTLHAVMDGKLVDAETVITRFDVPVDGYLESARGLGGVWVDDRCQHCSGLAVRTCPECSGDGRLVLMPDRWTWPINSPVGRIEAPDNPIIACPLCGGGGRVACPDCRGTGRQP